MPRVRNRAARSHGHGASTTERSAAHPSACCPAPACSFAAVGVPPAVMGIGPAVAIPAAVEMAGLTLDDIDVYEINEAFASQVGPLGQPVFLWLARLGVAWRVGTTPHASPVGAARLGRACQTPVKRAPSPAAPPSSTGAAGRACNARLLPGPALGSLSQTGLLHIFLPHPTPRPPTRWTSWGWTWSGSTPTAEPSRWATRWAAPGRARWGAAAA